MVLAAKCGIGNYSKALPTRYAVSLKISKIDGEDCADALAMGQMHKRCICEVHRTIGVTLHERSDFRQVIISDRRKGQRTGMDKFPGYLLLVKVGTYQMKQFCQHSFGCNEGQV